MKASFGRTASSVAALAILAAGCSEKPEQAGTVASTLPKPAAMTHAQREASKLVAGMVSAVKTDDSPPLATVKFELQSRPEIGQPLKVKLAFVPQQRADVLSATFVANSGLSIAADQPAPHFEDLETGAAYPYELTVVPKEKGVQYFSALVQLQGPAEPRVQTYSIPVIVGPPPGTS